MSARATQGELRIRTSPELHPTRFYGPLVADASYDSLAHLGAADASTTCAFDLAHTHHEDGFDSAPCIQMVFRYTTVVPVDGGSRCAACLGT